MNRGGRGGGRPNPGPAQRSNPRPLNQATAKPNVPKPGPRGAASSGGKGPNRTPMNAVSQATAKAQPQPPSKTQSNKTAAKALAKAQAKAQSQAAKAANSTSGPKNAGKPMGKNNKPSNNSSVHHASEQEKAPLQIPQFAPRFRGVLKPNVNLSFNYNAAAPTADAPAVDTTPVIASTVDFSQLVLIVQSQPLKGYDHWSLFVGRLGEVGTIYEVTEDSGYMRYSCTEGIAVEALKNVQKRVILTNSLDEDGHESIRQAAQNVVLPYTPNSADVKPNSQDWTVRVVEPLKNQLGLNLNPIQGEGAAHRYRLQQAQWAQDNQPQEIPHQESKSACCVVM